MAFAPLRGGLVIAVMMLGCEKAQPVEPTPLQVLVAPPTPPTPPAPTPLSWQVFSWGSAAALTQTAVDPRTCTLVCARDGKQVWSQPVCAAASSDFVFVAEDCSIAMVLFEYPMRGTPTESTHVAATVSGEGAQLYTLEQVMNQPARSKGEGRRVRWLAGAVGEPGVKPHKAGEAGVEFSNRCTDRCLRSTRSPA